MQIGVDLCDNQRIAKIYQKFADKFLSRILTQSEIQEFKSLEKHNAINFLATRYAAKEAIAKLLGTGIGIELSFQDLEILPIINSAPLIKFSSRAQELLRKQKISEIKISLSHEKQFSIAFAIGLC